VQIDAAILQQALDILRNDMTITLSKTDREILQQTYTNYRCTTSKPSRTRYRNSINFARNDRKQS
jgi:hypothetical protein